MNFLSIQKKINNKIISWITLILFLLPQFSSLVLAGPVSVGNTQTFVVSAYYSPLPNQKEYVWGSYEADKRMNGEGIRGSDFTKVYPGMIAAPSSYAFGTKIYIPGFGTGTVHDRGGRINEHGAGDRIDLWMGWGDDGRKRALQWGMKTVKGTIKPWNAKDSVIFRFVPANQQKKYGTTTVTIKNTKPTLGIGDKNQSVTNLQNFLKKRGYLSAQATGYYGNQTAAAVFEFQKEYKIISSWSDAGAGVFGPKTRAQAEKIWNDPVPIKTLAINTSSQKKSESIISKKEPQQTPQPTPTPIVKKSEPYNPDYAIIKPNLEKGDNGEAVERLQLVLKGMGYFSGIANGVYDNKTEEAVFLYQKSKKIVSSKTQKGAGRFGPQTYSTLVNELLEKQKRIKNPIASDIDFITKEQLAMRRQKINIALLKVQYGEKSSDVIALQNELIKRGFLPEGLNTGYYGNQTKTALEAYKNFIS